MAVSVGFKAVLSGADGKNGATTHENWPILYALHRYGTPTAKYQSDPAVRLRTRCRSTFCAWHLPGATKPARGRAFGLFVLRGPLPGAYEVGLARCFVRKARECQTIAIWKKGVVSR